MAKIVERLVTMTINVALVVAHAVMTVTQEVQEQDVARKFNDFYPSFAKMRRFPSGWNIKNIIY